MKESIVAFGAFGFLIVTGGAVAAKVTIPTEGDYQFDFGPIGHGNTFSNGDKLFAIHYDLNALLRTSPPGRAFDRMGAHCYGLYTNLNGKQAETGICEITDLDGDKWWM